MEDIASVETGKKSRVNDEYDNMDLDDLVDICHGRYFYWRTLYLIVISGIDAAGSKNEIIYRLRDIANQPAALVLHTVL